MPRRLALLAAATVAGLYLAQGLVVAWPRLRPAPPDMHERAQARGLPFDSRDALQVLEDLRRQGQTAALHAAGAYAVGQDGLPLRGGRILPLGGISASTVVFCNEFGSWVLFRSDEHGFNNPRGLYLPGKVDAVVIGDSFAEGSCVPQDQTITAGLRRRLPVALSFGTGGVGPLVELAALKEYAEPLRPRRVFWLYYASDPADLVRERRSPALLRYLDPGHSQRLLSRQKDVDDAWRAFLVEARRRADTDRPAVGYEQPLTWRARSARFLGGYYLRTLLRGSYPLDAADQENLTVFRRILGEARRRTASWGGELYFVYLPELKFFVAPRQADRFRGPILEAARAEGLPIIDGLEAFRRNPDPLSYFYLGHSTHYVPAGHAAVADAILGSLKKTVPDIDIRN